MIDHRVLQVGVVVVTYYPSPRMLFASVRQCCAQAAETIVVDNTDDLGAISEVKAIVDKANEEGWRVQLHQFGSNKGIAAAQNVGAHYLAAKGCTHILELDQDSFVPDGYIATMLNGFLALESDGQKVLGVGPRTCDEGETPIAAVGECRVVDKTLSSGFLYSVSALQLVGGKEEGLFIDLVDWEWCWRAASVGYSVFQNRSASIGHSSGEGTVAFLGLRVGKSRPVRIYYQYRNMTRMLVRGYVPLRRKLYMVGSMAFRLLAYVSVFSERGARVGMALKGVFDGIRGVQSASHL